MSQRSQTPGRRSQGGNSSDPHVTAAAEKAVHFLLAHTGAHNNPIKYADFKKCVFPDIRMEEPVKLVKKMLNDTFGYDLVELTGKKYILVSKIPNEGHVSLPKSAEGYRTLLSLVLAYIVMNRGEVEQRNLLKFLQQVDIGIDRPHPFFGDVADLLFKQNPTFVKDQYLTISVTEQGTFYNWGERAELEVNRRSVLDFVCEILGCDANDWKLHLKDCEEMDTES